MTTYIVMTYGESSGDRMRVLSKVSADSAKMAVQKVTGKKVKKDNFRNAPETGYAAVAESNFNEFR